MLVEINDRPSLVHVHARLVIEQVNIPMIEALYCVLASGRDLRRNTNTSPFELLAEL